MWTGNEEDFYCEECGEELDDCECEEDDDA